MQALVSLIIALATLAAADATQHRRSPCKHSQAPGSLSPISTTLVKVPTISPTTTPSLSTSDLIEGAVGTSSATSVKSETEVETSATPLSASSEVVEISVSSSISVSTASAAIISSSISAPETTEAISKLTTAASISPVPASSTISTTSSASAISTVVAEEPTSKYCGAPNSYEILSGTPWIVYSMNYNYEDIEGSCCTGFYSTEGSGDNQTIHWSSIWDIDASVNPNVVKGYSFIGLTQNLETTIDEITDIPTVYGWTVSNETAYKGNVVYDFMTSDTKGDSTSSNAQELMLWIAYEGGQVPIGWADGAVATIDGLYGKDGWKLYQGLNTDTGIVVSSLLVDEDNQFGDQLGGSFEGDIKDWLVALSKQGLFTTSTYVNVGNAGMEPFWGTVTFDNTLSLRVNV